MEIKRISVGELETNCYLIIAGEETKGVIIDPGAEPERIWEEVERQKVKVEYIINTHGHADHIGGNKVLKEKTGAEVLLHQKDEPLIQNEELNLASFLGKTINFPYPDRFLSHNEIIKVGKLSFQVIHTPGHTPGSITLKLNNFLFTGDTIFANSMGRYDFPKSSYQELISSLKTFFLPLSDEVVLYPGHGPASTIGRERWWLESL
jgi:glyoxylase-like metal-dependent hydrolase (beta-lactamase superfamily II)